MGGSFAQMRHPVCSPEDCDDARVSEHEQAPTWLDIPRSVLGARGQGPGL